MTTPLQRLADERLHAAIFRLSERRRAGDRHCDELLGRLLDEMDRRGDANDDSDLSEEVT